jgi:NAD+ synthase (glutamine-hydrolysing)
LPFSATLADSMTLNICVAQLNLVVGDTAGNARQIIDAAHTAHAQGAHVLLTPELAVSGYAAEDLYLRPGFLDACDDALKTIALQTAGLSGLHIVVGHPQRTSVAATKDRSVSVPGLINAATVLHQGRTTLTYGKRELPNYQVFDERRYFVPAQGDAVFEVQDSQGQSVRVGVLICEDAWFDAPVVSTCAAGAQLLAVINASPFHGGKGAEREQRLAERVRAVGVPLVYAHLVGGQDEVVFDGRSFALDAQGQVVARAAAFDTALMSVAWQKQQGRLCPVAAPVVPHPDADEDLWRALVMGVRDYVQKNRFPGVLLGLSGGIDSALVLAIAVDALGADRVRTVMMPSPYTADISWIDARDMAQRLGVRYDEIGIEPTFLALQAALASDFAGIPADTTEENLQARIRGTLLMALSNKFGALVLTTGNKSEMATGYCTLYGDMAGGFAVIKDVLKTAVFRLARWRNQHDPFGTGQQPIPERIITRPPSAELRPDQQDQDSLPAYEVLDAIIERFMENDQSPSSIVAEGFDAEAVAQVVRLIRINEYKRRQAPIGVRVTHRSFGKDWRYPITSQYRA